MKFVTPKDAEKLPNRYITLYEAQIEIIFNISDNTCCILSLISLYTT